MKVQTRLNAVAVDTRFTAGKLLEESKRIVLRCHAPIRIRDKRARVFTDALRDSLTSAIGVSDRYFDIGGRVPADSVPPPMRTR